MCPLSGVPSLLSPFEGIDQNIKKKDILSTHLHALHVITHNFELHFKIDDFVLAAISLEESFVQIVLHHVELPGHLLVLPLCIPGKILGLLLYRYLTRPKGQ